MMVRLIIYIVILYSSCKSEKAAPSVNIITDSVSKSQEVIVKDSTSEKDSSKNLNHNLKIENTKLNSRDEFDPKKEPSSIIPKNPVQRQMPLPGGVPDKHYIDSIKNARSRK